MHASPSVLDPQIEKRLERLARLQGTDPGLFVLAVHSFVEGFLRELIPLSALAEDSFGAFLQEFKSQLSGGSLGAKPQSLEVLELLRTSHYLTNKVRHNFADLEVSAARGATQHLIKFCQLARIDETEILRRIEEYLAAWSERRPLGELTKSLLEAGFKLQLEKNKSKQMTVQIDQMDALERKVALITSELEKERLRAQELEGTKRSLGERYDEARSGNYKLREELKQTVAQLEEYQEAKNYLEILSRMTVYTRTRVDYERTITRLTPEQRKVLERINLNEDFLIKGSAGTGKTLVLLKAIEKAKSGASGQTGFDLPEIQGSVVLLTYTTTLVKYDQYLSSLLLKDGSASRVATADAFLLERLRELNPGFVIDYRLAEELAGAFPAAGLSPRDLAAEIEGFIWGNDISYEEYVVEGVERRGMTRPLVKEQRIAVWSSCEAIEAAMEQRGRWSRNRAALLLARSVAAEEGARVSKTDFIFIDEAQDLPAAVLKALKACAERAVVLAGDADQSIYQPGFSFKRAGLEISGRTRVLKTNFRNTIQLHEVAERYRKASEGNDEENAPEAFREGPLPELFEGVDTEEMYSLLVSRIGIFLNALGYAPENICIVVPRDEELKQLRAKLSAEGLSLADIREKSFDFQETVSVRITTMHSAKGLDFPVVLLYLPQFNIMGSSLDPAASDRMARNLIYVAMTRALDHLNVFIRSGTENPALVDLAACFEVKA